MSNPELTLNNISTNAFAIPISSSSKRSKNVCITALVVPNIIKVKITA